MFDITQTYSVPLGRGGKYGTLAANCARFNDAVQQHVWEYGVRQLLNDAMADKTDDDGNALPVADLVAMAQKRLDQLYSGELRSRRAAGGVAWPTDAIESLAWDIAWDEKIAPTVKTFPEYKTLPKGTKDRVLATIHTRDAAAGREPRAVDTIILALLEAEPSIRREAKRRIDASAKAAVGIEL